MRKPFVVRVPLVPGVTDTPDNLSEIASTIQGMSGLAEVHLLPYNKVAGGKYKGLGMAFKPTYDETRKVRASTEPFERCGIKAVIL
jgi:pyruvate formate lyase activating enzyme